MKQPEWLVKAKETYEYHRSHLMSHDKWTLKMTARSLRRSIGSISEDRMIAIWCKTHEKQLEKFDYAKDALEFIRKEKAKEERL